MNTTTLHCHSINWKSSHKLCAWDIFQAQTEPWLTGEKVEKAIQYTKIVLMLGDEGLSRWTKKGTHQSRSPATPGPTKASTNSLALKLHDLSFRLHQDHL